MTKELSRNYDPAREEALYAEWLKRGYFKAAPNPDKEPYTIMIPPPNITGELHMGHALNNTIQDILIRSKRMQGYETLWMPGTDHAAISTEVRVCQELDKEGTSKEEIGRDKFLERVWAWRAQYGGTIINQLKKLGCSCDWERERFTMDEGLSDAVLEVFVRLYDEGKIYRGERLINWCIQCQTTISDAEVDHEDREGTLWYFKYPVMGTSDFISFATTRPETMLGDTAVAVNPSDERYAAYIGKKVLVPSVNREIPIIADDYVDAEYGTGVVKITPGHDPNDFEVGERHKLPVVNILNDDGSVNENGGPYKGLTREATRVAIIKEMSDKGLFIKEEKITHAVGTHERCNKIVEPLIKLQWFLKMEELAKPALDAYKNGDLRFNRERFGKIYQHWLVNIRDWCISRQIWWGHRIPAYYCDCGHVLVAKAAPAACGKCGSDRFRQDEDTLDTWFSSALWPFSTLGWPEKTPELDYFYPTNVLVTALDIIFFWVVRMVFSGLKHMGEVPFKDVFIYGLVLDDKGKKMSKSKGNGIDPLDVINQYGADALRLMLVSGNAIENDTRFYWERMDFSRNFLNKIWNATRFVLMNSYAEGDNKKQIELQTEDKWILSLLNNLIKEVTEKLDAYELGLASQKIVDFIWDEFCDWYLEIVKPRLYNKDESGANSRDAALWTLKEVLLTAVKLLHPFTPFITEDLFLSLQSNEETVMLSAWPKYKEENHNPSAEKEIERIKEAVRAIRNIRTEKQVPPSQKISVVIQATENATADIFNRSKGFMGFLCGASSIGVLGTETPPENAVSVVVAGAAIFLPLSDLVDTAKEKERLSREKERLAKELERVESKLNNEGFMAKAPADVVNAEREKRRNFIAMLKKVDEQIGGMG
jgi:valyl-tRNA synthetase